MKFIELYGIIFVALFCFAFLYIYIAKKFSFYDVPNERSSHKYPTIIGGGILFPLAALSSIFVPQSISFHAYLLGMGILTLASIGFIDDCIKPVPIFLRIFVQICCIFILFYIYEIQLSVYSSCLFVVCLFFINASNFMDGINGMTGLYGGINLLSFLFIFKSNEQQGVQIFTVFILIAVFVFLFFNLRMKAIWFAGDVGSTSLAYLFIILLIMVNENFSPIYFLFFFIYFLDTGFTVIERFILKENIFHPHKKHLYQLLSKHTSLSQVKVSLSFSLIQLTLNLIILFCTNSYFFLLILIISLILLYVYLKYYVLRKLIKQTL